MTSTADKGATIAQAVAGQFRRWRMGDPPPTEKTSLPDDMINPLKLALGGYVKVDVPDLDKATFSVDVASEFTRHVGKQNLKFVDYWLHDPDTAGSGDDGLWATLRAIPNDKGGVDILLMRPCFDSAFNADLEKALNGDEITDDDTAVKYQKRGAYNSDIREFSGAGEKNLKLKYWEFINEEETDPRFYIVEMDLSDREGWISAYRGTVITTYDAKPIAGHASARS